MRRAVLLAVAFLAAVAAPAVAQDEPLTVMAFNLRYASNTPPNAWPDRRPVVREVIERWRPDIIGTQEGLYQQIRDIDADLPAYAWIGEGRDGGSGGEFMAVFYRTDRLEPRQYGHYWLSDTPETIASRSWGNTLPRMVTWVRFRDRSSGQEHYLINTHFDHQSQPSRERSAALVIARATGLDSTLPVILVGDFNAAAGENPVHAILTRDGGFTDTWTAAGRRDTLGTFHNFRGLEAARDAGRIDWVLVRGGIETLSADIVTDHREGQYPSDHFPVIARVRLPQPPPETGSLIDGGKEGQYRPDSALPPIRVRHRRCWSRLVSHIDAGPADSTPRELVPGHARTRRRAVRRIADEPRHRLGQPH